MSLFQEFVVGGVKLRTRTARSATWENMATPEGAPTAALTAMMASLAHHRVGLIITSHTFVAPDGQAGPGQLALHNDSLVSGHRELVSAVHSEGGAVCVQLAHAGMAAFDAVVPVKVGPSAGKDNHEASLADIDRIVAAFTAAAVRARDAGYDAVQVHGAHGYLISQFLGSPNKRTDDYGGSLENRARLLLRVVRSIREALGAAFPVFVKMNVSDFEEGGLTIEESARIVEWLADAGVSMVEASGGTLYGKTSPIRRFKDSTEGYHKEGAVAWRKAVQGRGVAVCLVGGIRTPQAAQGFIDEGSCDMVSMSRPFVREPDLVSKWEQSGSKAGCISCSKCFGTVLGGKGISCPIVDALASKKN